MVCTHQSQSKFSNLAGCLMNNAAELARAVQFQVAEPAQT